MGYRADAWAGTHPANRSQLGHRRELAACSRPIARRIGERFGHGPATASDRWAKAGRERHTRGHSAGRDINVWPPGLRKSRRALGDLLPASRWSRDGPPSRMTSAAARSLPELLVHSPGVREGIPLLGGSIVRRSEQPLSSRGLRRHPRAHARTEVPRWHARAAQRREATHPSLSVAAATLQPAWPASNFGLGCPLDESRPTTSPGTGSR